MKICSNCKVFSKTVFRLKIWISASILFIYVVTSDFNNRSVTIKEFSSTGIPKKSPPVVIELMGGLGNQLFQYAAAYSLAKKRNSDLYLCLNAWDFTFKTFIKSYYSSTQRKYSLDQFAIPQDKLIYFYPFSSSEVDEYFQDCSIDYTLDDKKVEHVRMREINFMSAEGFLLNKDKVILLKDWFESEIFFADVKQDVINTFKPIFDASHIAPILEKVWSSQNSVSVHIRRGDMGRTTDFRLISINYQRKAMKLIKQKLNAGNVTFFIFTDDVPYVKRHLNVTNDENSEIIFASDFTNENTLYDFLLMMNCQHNIIPNSSFSWWAAYLNRNPKKIVIAPKPKYASEWIENNYNKTSHKRKLIGEFAYPQDWLTMEPEFVKFAGNE